MSEYRFAEATRTRAPQWRHSAPPSPVTAADVKARQSAKIREFGQALIDAGLRTLDAQAKALSLSRSTAWTVLKARHKSSGLSAAIIERMLASPQLPPRARTVLVEYVEEKSFGVYGGSRRQNQLFAVRLLHAIDGPSSQAVQIAIRERRRSMPGRASVSEPEPNDPSPAMDWLLETT